MTPEPELLRVPLDSAFVMQLRPSELESVAEGVGEFDASATSDFRTLVAALCSMPSRDRASMWELAVRRYGRRKPLEQAAGEIGMDVVRGRALLEVFSRALMAAPPPEGTADR